MQTSTRFFLWVFGFVTQVAQAELVISHVSGGVHSGHEDYNIELIHLALQKTRTEYGDYTLIDTPFYEVRRRIFSLQTNKYPNLVVEISYDEKLTQSGELTFINFPIELGIVGYRVCFVNPAIKNNIAQAKTLEDLRQYTIVQGIEWPDTKILRHNGFKVTEIDDFESLFKMTAGGRIDLFCRGVNEIKKELDDHKNITNLSADESFVLIYPLPRFFYLNSTNTFAKERIEKGLKIAYNDGSLKQLLRRHYQSSFQFAKLKKRKIFRLENPDLKALSNEYTRYVIDPLQEQ